MRRRDVVSAEVAHKLACETRYEIYALVDPRTMRPRYVGRALSRKNRLKSHLSGALTGTGKNAAWLRELINAGTLPVVVLLQDCANAWEAVEGEQHWYNVGYHHLWGLLNRSFPSAVGLHLGNIAPGRAWTLTELEKRGFKRPIPPKRLVIPKVSPFKWARRSEPARLRATSAECWPGGAA